MRSHFTPMKRDPVNGAYLMALVEQRRNSPEARAALAVEILEARLQDRPSWLLRAWQRVAYDPFLRFVWIGIGTLCAWVIGVFLFVVILGAWVF